MAGARDARRHEAFRTITGLHVLEQKLRIAKGKITEYRVTMQITFGLED